MKVTVTETSTWQRTLELEIPRERVEEEESKFLKEYQKQVDIPGFRKGKAPEKMVLQRHGDAIRSDAIEEILPRALTDALTGEDISPLAPPRVVDLDFGEEGPLTVKAVVEVMPEFEVKGYKKLKLEKPVRPITEEDVDEALGGLRERTAELVPVDRAAGDGDYLLADIIQCDESGAPIIGQKSENRTLMVAEEGEGSGVGRQLMGVRKGDERRVVVEHDEEAPDAAGQEGTHKHIFLVQVHEVKEKRLPELDDEYARGLGEFDDLADLRKRVREDLEGQMEEEARKLMVGQAIDQLIKKNDIEVPQSLIRRYLDGVVEDYKQALEQQGAGAQMDEQAVRNEYRGMATVQLQWQLMQSRIAEQEGLEVTEEEVREQTEAFAENYDVGPEEAYRALAAQGRLDRIRSELREKKVVDLIIDSAKVKEKKVSPKEEEAPAPKVVTPSSQGRSMIAGGDEGPSGPESEGPGDSGLIIPGR
ncbi:MAG: trigger factor [bacterium]